MKKYLFVILLVLPLLVVRSQEDGSLRGMGNERRGNEQAAITDALGTLNSVITGIRNGDNDITTMDDFNPNACKPDFGSDASAMMPSTCGENPGCAECYRSAVSELNFIRRQLGRLGCIFRNTIEFNNAAISFGDNASGIHAVTGLAWQAARAEIMTGLESFKKTYDRKYVDMMGSLKKALESVSKCEDKFGTPDWYQRFGFMYFEFMKEKYKRSE
ncbi:MAG: hypothetical protein EOO09_00170 [Chitinophagaceae bacterium]|nr:MAG: hypothetical protein EOO09_00170 [Chitinophagaceae bacterium]